MPALRAAARILSKRDNSKSPPLLDQTFDRDPFGEFYPRAAPDRVENVFQSPPALHRHRNQPRLLHSTAGNYDLFTLGCALNQLCKLLPGLKNSYPHFSQPPNA